MFTTHCSVEMQSITNTQAKNNLKAKQHIRLHSDHLEEQEKLRDKGPEKIAVVLIKIIKQVAFDRILIESKAAIKAEPYIRQK